MRIWVFLLAGFALGTVVVAEEDIWSKTINNSSNGTWNFQPETPKAKYLKVPDLPGGRAYRVSATRREHPWDVQANSPIQGAINEGDVIMLMYYARAAEAAEGGSTLTARIQLKAEPYTSVLDMSSPISEQWNQYCAHRVSPASLPANSSNVSIHLATARQVIELGPVFVFNFGRDYKGSLKGCDG